MICVCDIRLSGPLKATPQPNKNRRLPSLCSSSNLTCIQVHNMQHSTVVGIRSKTMMITFITPEYTQQHFEQKLQVHLQTSTNTTNQTYPNSTAPGRKKEVLHDFMVPYLIKISAKNPSNSDGKDGIPSRGVALALKTSTAALQLNEELALRQVSTHGTHIDYCRYMHYTSVTVHSHVPTNAMHVRRL